ncbi:hypothetical protein D3C74_404090 [compost metagenome]
MAISIFGMVRVTFSASGAPKLLQLWDIASCSAASGMQASQPPKMLARNIVQGIGTSTPRSAPTPSTAAKNSSCTAASSAIIIVYLARYTEVRVTGRASSCFQPPSACSARQISAAKTPDSTGRKNMA